MSILGLPSIPYIPDVYKTIEDNKDVIDNNSSNVIINFTLKDYLYSIKEQIDGQQDMWDRFKKYTNSHEYIHTPVPQHKTAICKYRPLSRSFYKMIEIINSLDILDSIKNNCKQLKSFHFAEGPGGFIEAICYLYKGGIHYGMTLIDDSNPTVPGWKKSETFLKENPNVTIDSGADNTGDLFSSENLRHCLKKYRGKIDFVTADGGFDFSTDFNAQEICGTRLLLAQITYALAVQKKGGIFIVKFFDTFTRPSVDMLYLLSTVYSKVNIIKPHTSRQANSEKYVVCQDYNIENATPLVNKLANVIYNLTQDVSNISCILKSVPPCHFVNRIEECNAILGQQQIESISNTLHLIENTRIEKIESMKKANIQKCIMWCQKNKLPYYKTLSASNIFLDKNNL